MNTISVHSPFSLEMTPNAIPGNRSELEFNSILMEWGILEANNDPLPPKDPNVRSSRNTKSSQPLAGYTQCTQG